MNQETSLQPHRPPNLNFHFEVRGLRQRGQVILEYILMVVVALAISAIIMRVLVSKNPDSPGALLSRWHAILVQIGQDDPNRSK